MVFIALAITSVVCEYNYGKEYENLKDVSSKLSMSVPHRNHSNMYRLKIIAKKLMKTLERTSKQL